MQSENSMLIGQDDDMRVFFQPYHQIVVWVLQFEGWIATVSGAAFQVKDPQPEPQKTVFFVWARVSLFNVYLMQKSTLLPPKK